MLFDETAMTDRLARAFGLELRVALAERALPRARLTRQERSILAAFGSTPRARSWRTGRAALKRLRAFQGEPADTSAIRFPHPRYSVTHSRGYAAAVGAPSGCAAGIGIDLELLRPVDARAARFFLTAAERAWVERLPSARRAVELLRLWTIKEALFKADPLNRGMGLADYSLAEPAADRGRVEIRRGSVLELRYLSHTLEAGFLSAAVAYERSGDDQ